VYVFEELRCRGADFIHVSKQCRTCAGTGVGGRETSTCPCCKRLGSRNRMVGKSIDWTPARSSSSRKPCHSWSDAEVRFPPAASRCMSSSSYFSCCEFSCARQYPAVNLSFGGIYLLRAGRTFGKCFIAFLFRVLHEVQTCCA